MSPDLRRRLVVVRAGDGSLHPQWLEKGEAPTFDLAVCYYGDDPTAFSDCALRHAVKGGKWDGLHAFFAADPSVFEKYDWIWLPDDDVATNAACINRLFDLVEEHKLDVAQPSLSWDSYYSHFITLQNPRFELRWTNFAEIMVPVFRASFLREIFSMFAGAALARDSITCGHVGCRTPIIARRLSMLSPSGILDPRAKETSHWVLGAPSGRR